MGKDNNRKYFKNKKEFKEKMGMTPLELSRKIRKETNENLNKPTDKEKHQKQVESVWEKFCEGDGNETYTQTELLAFAEGYHDGGCKTCSKK